MATVTVTYDSNSAALDAMVVAERTWREIPWTNLGVAKAILTMKVPELDGPAVCDLLVEYEIVDPTQATMEYDA